MGDLLQPHILIVLFVLGALFFLALWVLPLWFVCKKAGFSPWLTLLNCIPFGTPVLLYLLAFADWRGPAPVPFQVQAASQAPARQAIHRPQLVVR